MSMSVDDRKGKCEMFGVSGAVGYGLYAQNILWKEEIYNNLNLETVENMATGSVIEVVVLEDNDYLMYIPAKMSWESRVKEEDFRNAEQCKEYFWSKLGQYVDDDKDNFMEEVDYVNVAYMD